MRPSAPSITRPVAWPPYGTGSSLPFPSRETARTRRHVPNTDAMPMLLSKFRKDPLEHRGRALVEPHGSAYPTAPGVGVPCRRPFLRIRNAGVFELVHRQIFRLRLDRGEAAGADHARYFQICG